MAGQEDVTGEQSVNKMITMGRIAGPYGVRGWSHVVTYTQAPANLLDLSPWYLKAADQWETVNITTAKTHGKGLVVKLAECDDRDAAALNTGKEIGIARSQLPATEKNEYYWNDLVGLQVVTSGDQVLGVVDYLIETGSNDVLVIKGDQEYLIPFIQGEVIKQIDLDGGVIKVDWDPDF